MLYMVVLMYLLVLWAVLGRIANAAINRMFVRRICFLQVHVVPVLYIACSFFVTGSGLAWCIGAVLSYWPTWCVFCCWWVVLARIVHCACAAINRMLARGEYTPCRCGGRFSYYFHGILFVA
jgi:hypothetical protein